MQKKMMEKDIDGQDGKLITLNHYKILIQDLASLLEKIFKTRLI